MPHETSKPPLREALARGHQSDDVREGWTAVVAVSMAVALPLIMVGIWLQYRWLAGPRYRGLTAPTFSAPASQPGKTLPEPRLETVPGLSLGQLRAQEGTVLNTYGWIDREHGVVRIPIERAMELLAARGLPVRGPNATNTGQSEYDLIIERSRQRQETPIKEAK